MMFRMFRDDDMMKAAKDINDYWKTLMPMMCAEEAGELIQAISKVERTVEGFETAIAMDWRELAENEEATAKYEAHVNAVIDLRKEMADMCITLMVLMNRYNIPWELI